MKSNYVPSLLRLLKVNGFENRCNDVVYGRPLNDAEKCLNVTVFFGGDVQDFTENMNSHRDNKNYSIWNLENTAKLLQSHFPSCHIVVVKPSKMEYKTFSCYQNFVKSNDCGVPEHSPTYNGLLHLQTLLQSISEKVKTMPDEEIENAIKLSTNALVEYEKDQHTATINESVVKDTVPVSSFRTIPKLHNCDIKLIGFSKGCVVLNQLLYEFHHYTATQNIVVPDIMSRVKEMYWLDGGHNGGKNTWITAKDLLETLASLNIKVHVHVSPYQIKDERRPWIGKEEKQFSDILQRLGAPVNRNVHFRNVPPSLDVHFNVLKVFAETT